MPINRLLPARSSRLHGACGCRQPSGTVDRQLSSQIGTPAILVDPCRDGRDCLHTILAVGQAAALLRTSLDFRPPETVVPKCRSAGDQRITCPGARLLHPPHETRHFDAWKSNRKLDKAGSHFASYSLRQSPALGPSMDEPLQPKSLRRDPHGPSSRSNVSPRHESTNSSSNSLNSVFALLVGLTEARLRRSPEWGIAT